MLLIPPPPGSAAEPVPPPQAEENFPDAPSPSAQPQTDGEPEAKAADGEAGAVPMPVEVTEDGEPVEDGAHEKPPAPLAPVPEYFVFSTGARVVGVSSFPLTGDPSQVRSTSIFSIPLYPGLPPIFHLTVNFADDGHRRAPGGHH
jgi:hypothetical protein